MSLNNTEINLILSELQLEGAMVQKFIQPDFSTLIITFYKPGEKINLLISLKQGEVRIHKTSAPEPKIKKQQRFVQFLKAILAGGKITRVSQPGNDRIVCIEITGNKEITLLWIRLWSSSANIIVTDQQGEILDTYYRKPGKKETTGEIFRLPEKNSEKNYPVREYPDRESFNSFIDSFYSTQGSEKEKSALIEQLKNNYNKKISYLRAGKIQVDEKLAEFVNYEKYMHYGQLILANIYQIEQGSKWLETEDYFSDPKKITTIELDPEISPEKSAENYFRKYRNSKEAVNSLIEEKKNIENKLSFLEKDLEHLLNENNPDLLKKAAGKKDLSAAVKNNGNLPGLTFMIRNFKILAGRTAAENDELLRKHVRGNDLWFHARDYPGGYIFIKSDKSKSVPLDILLAAGSLAIHFSKGRNSGKGEVYYTQVKYLRRIKNGKTGLVIPTREKNLSINVEENIIRNILNSAV